MMKKYFLMIALALVSGFSFAQEGIQFNHGTWKEALAKAKAENKLVFVDLYTSWCGPCKQMVAEVFPKKEVGDVFNSSFVNYKIDAEKGEGVGIAKLFEVRAYPTYLFVNGDGELIYRTLGYLEPKAFLQEAAIALKEQNDPKPLVKWMKEYDGGKRGKEFLIGYLKKRAMLKLPSAEIVEEIFPFLSDTDLNNKEILSTLLFYNPNTTYMPSKGFFKYVTAHYKAIDSILGKSTAFSLYLLQTGLRNYFKKEIIENKRENMLPVMISATKELGKLLDEKDIEVSVKRLVMDYYAGTGNEAKLIPAAIDYVEKGLMKIDVEAIKAEDKIAYQKFLEPYLTGKADSTKTQNWYTSNRLMRNNKILPFSYNLRSAAEAIYHGTKDKKALSMAIAWAMKANEYFPHFSTESVYAGLLFKMGRKQEAINMMVKASEDGFIKGTDKQKLLLDNIAKIKVNEAPEKLW